MSAAILSPHPRPWLLRADDEPPGLEDESGDDEPPALEAPVVHPPAVQPPAAAARPTSASSKEPEFSGITPEMAKRMVQGGAASGKTAKPGARPASGLGGSSRERGSPTKQPLAQPGSAAPANGTDTDGMPELLNESSDDEGAWLATIVMGSGVSGRVPLRPALHLLAPRLAYCLPGMTDSLHVKSLHLARPCLQTIHRPTWKKCARMARRAACPCGRRQARQHLQQQPQQQPLRHPCGKQRPPSRPRHPLR